MNDDSILGAALGQLGQTVKQAAKQVVKLPEEVAREEKPQEKKSEWESDEERVKFLRDLYGRDKTANPSDKKPTEFEDQIKDKSPEEQKKLLELRSQLHKENYYDPTFNRPQKQEERPAEKVENEKKQEMQDLQQKDAKKPPPLAVVREQNKTEIFRGTAG